MDTIEIVGLGYIGLPTAAIIASRGKSVIGVDVNAAAVETINSGNIHIVEPDLDIVVRSAVTTGKLRATTRCEPADAFIIAVPTPFGPDHEPDLSYIKNAAQMIAPVLERGNLVILESTSPVGTTEKVCRWLAEARPDLSFPDDKSEKSDIRIAYCPERVLPGHILQELVVNDRIIGGMTPACSEMAAEVYRIFVKGDCIVTTSRTAELCKLVENAYRDVNIAYANELSIICDKLDISVWELISLANRHPRVNILNPGPGVGGHCIAVDPWFIVDSAPDEARLIKMAREVNDSKPDHVYEKIVSHANRFKDPVVAFFGLSFKPDIDDLRESPALDIVKKAADARIGKLLIVEPNVDVLPPELQGIEGVEKTDEAQALAQADIIVGLVAHAEFMRLSKERLKEHVVIDAAGIWQ